MIKYEWKAYWASSYVDVTPPVVQADTGSMFKVWGNAFSAGVHGISITITTRSPDTSIIGDTGTYTATFTCPWAANVVVTAASYLTLLRWKVQFDDYVHTHTCSSWTLSFSAMRLVTVDALGNTTGTLLTVGAQSISGTGYNPLLDYTYGNRDSNIYGTSVVRGYKQPPICVGSFGAQTISNYHNEGNIEIGYRHYDGTVWIEDPIALIPLTDPGYVDCAGCVPILGNITDGVTPASAWRVFLNSELYKVETKTDLGNITLHCVPPRAGDVDAVWHIWRINSEWRYRTSSIYIVPKTDPMRHHLETLISHCGLTEIITTTPVVDTYAVCSSTEYTERGVWVKYCHTVITPGSCASPPPETDPGHVDTSAYNDSTCWEDLDWSITWDVTPTCSDSPFLAMCLDYNDMHYLTYVEGLVIKLFVWDILGNEYRGTIRTLSFACTGLGISFGITGCLTVKYSSNGTSYVTENYAHGHDTYWSTPVSFGSGTELACSSCWINDVEYTALLVGTTWKLYARKLNSGTDDYVADIVTGVAVTSRGALTSSQNSYNMVSFVYQDSGTIYRLGSFNYGLNWEVI